MRALALLLAAAAPFVGGEVLAEAHDLGLSASSRARQPVLELRVPRAGNITVAQVEFRARDGDGRRGRLPRVRAVDPRRAGKDPVVVGGVQRKRLRQGISRRRFVASVAVLNRRTGGSSSTGSSTGSARSRRAKHIGLRLQGPSSIKILKSERFANAFAAPVKAGFCKQIKRFRVGLARRTNVHFGGRLLAGRLPKGFLPRYLGAYAFHAACGQPVPGSFVRALRGRRPTPPQPPPGGGQTGGGDDPGGGAGGGGGAPPQPGGTDAVVLVSGLRTTTPFTTPSQACEGGEPLGRTWTFVGQSLKNMGYRVFTAPVNAGPGPVSPDPPGFFNCPAIPSSVGTLNSVGDVDANGAALIGFLEYLNAQFQVTTVHLVGHSDGGLWARSAVDWSHALPEVQILSLTTVATPHLGAFVADLIEGALAVDCKGSVACELFIAAITAYAKSEIPGPALAQLTRSFMTGWNGRHTGAMNGIPMTAIAGEAVTFAGESDRYVSPNDVLVGVSSAQASGLDRIGVLPDLRCFSPLTPDTHSAAEVPLVPGSRGLTTDPATVSQLAAALGGQRPSTGCPNPAGVGP